MSETFDAFEHAGWDSVDAGYHRHFERLTCQTIGPLLDGLRVASGVRLLDIASGPGYVAAAAAARGAEPVGLDFSATQIALARAAYPAIAFRQGSAADLPFADNGFDAVSISFGMLHFAEPERVLAEAFRVLRKGGRFGFTVWAKPEAALGFGILLEAVGAHGRMDVALPPGPPVFRFADADEARRALGAAGFVEAAIETLPLAWRFDSPDGLLAAFAEGTVRMRALLQAQSPEAMRAIAAAMRRRAAAHAQAQGVDIPMAAVLATASKPA